MVALTLALRSLSFDQERGKWLLGRRCDTEVQQDPPSLPGSRRGCPHSMLSMARLPHGLGPTLPGTAADDPSGGSQASPDLTPVVLGPAPALASS